MIKPENKAAVWESLKKHLPHITAKVETERVLRNEPEDDFVAAFTEAVMHARHKRSAEAQRDLVDQVRRAVKERKP